VAPGAFDPLAARLVEETGFPAVYMTGFGTSAALLGRPDAGLLTMTEMADNAARIAACVDIPVIADAHTGYGNPLNVIRTVGAYESAGVAGLHTRGSGRPQEVRAHGRQAGHPAQEMAAKVRAAAQARTQPEFVIIARTDARAVEGLDAAMERAQMYLAAGADALSPSVPCSPPPPRCAASCGRSQTLARPPRRCPNCPRSASSTTSSGCPKCARPTSGTPRPTPPAADLCRPGLDAA
jgi:2,3-dimethylmalate lyase